MDQDLPFLLIFLTAASVTTDPLICAMSSSLQSVPLIIHEVGIEDARDLSRALEMLGG